jgi:hypothetical protein
MGRHGAIATAVPPGATLPPPPCPASGASSARRYRRPARLAGRVWVEEEEEEEEEFIQNRTRAGARVGKWPEAAGGGRRAGMGRHGAIATAVPPGYSSRSVRSGKCSWIFFGGNLAIHGQVQ